MANTPGRAAFDPTHALQQQINELRALISNLTNKSLYSASIGAGGITVNGGQITLKGTASERIDLGPGAQSVINMYPDGTGNYIQLQALPTTDQGTGSSVVGLLMRMLNASNAYAGGWAGLWSTGVSMGYTTGGVNKGFLEVDTNGNLEISGGIAYGQNWFGQAALYLDAYDAGTGPVAISATYGTTFSSAPNVLLTDFQAAGASGSQAITAESTTGYTAGFSSTNDHQARIWGYRHQ